MNTNTPQKTLDALRGLVEAQADDPSLAEFLGVASQTAHDLIGHRLFTILVVDGSAMEVERIYSNRPDAYPVGGRKSLVDTAWGRLVLEGGQPYIGRNADDIREHFADHDVILGLGLEAILNVPIRLGGTTIGTMNLLNTAEFYGETHVPSGQLIAGVIAGRLVRASR